MTITKLFWNNDNLKKLIDTIHNFEYKELLLCLILSFGDSEILQYLIDHNIDINIKPQNSNLYPIHHLLTSAEEAHTKDAVPTSGYPYGMTFKYNDRVFDVSETPIHLGFYLNSDCEFYKKLALMVKHEKVDFNLKTLSGISLLDYALKLDHYHKFRILDILFIHSHRYTMLTGIDKLNFLNCILNEGCQTMRDIIVEKHVATTWQSAEILFALAVGGQKNMERGCLIHI